jgi:hypothetical protein
MVTEMIVEWTCPHCRTINQDDFVATLFPICENCNHSTEWWELLTTEQWNTGNAILKAMEKQ